MKIINVLNTKAPKSNLQKNGTHNLGIRNSKWLSFPYILWMAGFIIIPLIVIVYYGMTTNDKRITIDNIASILNPINLRALRLALELSLIST